MKSIVFSLTLCFAFSAQAAPPILAHCGGCGMGESKAKSDHVHNKKASIGHAAPSFTLKDLNGKTHSLAQYKGKTVVLEWFNPECPFVVSAHGKGGVLENLAQKVSSKDTVWLAINSGAKGRQGHGKSVNQSAAKKWKMKHPILVDADGQVGKAYGAKTTPHMFVVDAKGNLAFKGGPDNAPSGRKGSSYQAHLSNALGDLAAGKKVSKSSTSSWGCSVKYGR
jgi:peroxiredoxin